MRHRGAISAFVVTPPRFAGGLARRWPARWRLGECAGPPRPGFTLIELLVVIGVILLLVALTITVATNVVLRSEIRETENTIRLLDTALDDWEMQSGRRLSYGRDGQPVAEAVYEIPQVGAIGDETAIQFTDRLWSITGRPESIRQIIANVNPEFVRELDPAEPGNLDLAHLNGFGRSVRFVDAWDQPIIAVHPGRRWVDGDDIRDEDGTIRTAMENRLGVAVNRRIYFVSAGPSGQFGNLHLRVALDSLSDTQQQEVDRAADNIYSYPVLTEEARP